MLSFNIASFFNRLIHFFVSKLTNVSCLLKYTLVLALLSLFSVRFGDDLYTFLCLSCLGILLLHLLYLRKPSIAQSYICDITIFIYLFTIYVVSFFIFMELMRIDMSLPKTQSYFWIMSMLFRALSRLALILFVANFYSIYALRKLYQVEIFNMNFFVFLGMTITNLLFSSVLYLFYLGVYDLLVNPPEFLLNLGLPKEILGLSPNKTPTSWLGWAVGPQPVPVIERITTNSNGESKTKTILSLVGKLNSNDRPHEMIYNTEEKRGVSQMGLCESARMKKDFASNDIGAGGRAINWALELVSCMKAVDNSVKVEIEHIKLPASEKK